MFSPISNKSWKEFQSIIKVKHFEKGTMLCEFNSIPTNIYFLNSGYARAFSVDTNGKEFNMILYSPNRFMGSFSSIIEKTKATLAIECLSDCEALVINYNEFIKIANKNLDFGIFYRKLIEYYLVKLQTYVIRLVSMSATERYLAFKVISPSVEGNIAQYHIASHLGITPIQLSRIRKKLLKSKTRK